ncbi:hypothetical protein B4U84_07660 [Westiellopsis prolifica IICB1]|nr:hypothetical protein B4U84_07660 [Westiellopsis prolifica IICB1]
MKQPCCLKRGVRGDQNATRQLYKTCVYTAAQAWERDFEIAPLLPKLGEGAGWGMRASFAFVQEVY